MCDDRVGSCTTKIVDSSRFAQGEVRRLEELHLSALELRHEASIRVGEHSSTIPDLEKLVAEHPFRERLVALLMEAMAGSGRRFALR